VYKGTKTTDFFVTAVSQCCIFMLFERLLLDFKARWIFVLYAGLLNLVTVRNDPSSAYLNKVIHGEKQ
jgi:hypothetical protein